MVTSLSDSILKPNPNYFPVLKPYWRSVLDETVEWLLSVADYYINLKTKEHVI